MYDVIIAGGGPVGLYCAKLCGEMGFRVLVLEEHTSAGRPLHCSGLVSSNIKKFVPEISETSSFVENTVDSAVVHSRLSSFRLRKRGIAAYVIDRTAFDRMLLESLHSEIKLGLGVTGIKTDKKCVTVRTRWGMERGAILIGCDGAGSFVAKHIGSGPKETINGLFGIRKEEDFSGNVDLYFDKDMVSDGFFWRIPRGTRTEYGVLGKGVNFEYIKDFFRMDFRERFGGVIGLGLSGRSYSDRIMLAGGSAGQVKPWSGGGVVYGLACAEMAAMTVRKAFSAEDFSAGVLRGYETAWKKKIGTQIYMGMHMRDVMRKLDNFELDAAFMLAKFLPLNWMDMDFLLKW
jgi:flavin-dependent dehydrogenase